MSVLATAKKLGTMLALILLPVTFAVTTMIVTDPPQTGGVCSLHAQEIRRLDIAHETGTTPVAYTERGCQR